MIKELDIFSQTTQTNPLKGKRICLSGEFRMNQKELYTKLRNVGVTTIDRVSETREYKEGDVIPPVKESTNYFVIGNNPNEDSLKRHGLNEHDGYHAKIITQDTLYDYLNGLFTEDDYIPDTVEKHLKLDFSYYNWKAPVINGKTYVSRLSSPIQFDSDGKTNPITQKEIYVSPINGVDMGVVFQMIGNLGGYANREFFEDTRIVLLSDESVNNLKKGVKDENITYIENKYNSSNSKVFNIQFTCEADFVGWVQSRVTIFPDESTIHLLNEYLKQKGQNMKDIQIKE